MRSTRPMTTPVTRSQKNGQRLNQAHQAQKEDDENRYNCGDNRCPSHGILQSTLDTADQLRASTKLAAQ